MKTKPFLLATAGSTVDGRVIDDKMLKEMASSYDPKTYGARLNIEHIRGISGGAPFMAYGDVLELTTAEVDVNMNGATEKRTALYGVLDVTPDAKKLNEAGQKLYPSIEIEPNFAAKGFAYLMGCALTDSPAAIGTERMKFNRALPGVLTLTGTQDAPLEFDDEADKATQEVAGVVKGFFSKLTDMLTPAAPATAVVPPVTGDPPAFDAAKFATDLGATLETAFTKMGEANTAAITALSDKFAALEKRVDTTADPTHLVRPAAAGVNGQFARTDC